RPLVFIDESGFAHDMPRLHGYAAKGSRCFGTHDWGQKDVPMQSELYCLGHY
ncbi:MAG: hypothetical protein QG556_139, partial [Pseudomonadota bacterium]|nr:hypothetical protein [Pseudomonadota bacterium]